MPASIPQNCQAWFDAQNIGGNQGSTPFFLYTWHSSIGGVVPPHSFAFDARATPIPICNGFIDLSCPERGKGQTLQPSGLAQSPYTLYLRVQVPPTRQKNFPRQPILQVGGNLPHQPPAFAITVGVEAALLGGSAGYHLWLGAHANPCTQMSRTALVRKDIIGGQPLGALDLVIRVEDDGVPGDNQMEVYVDGALVGPPFCDADGDEGAFNPYFPGKHTLEEPRSRGSNPPVYVDNDPGGVTLPDEKNVRSYMIQKDGPVIIRGALFQRIAWFNRALSEVEITTMISS